MRSISALTLFAIALIGTSSELTKGQRSRGNSELNGTSWQLVKLHAADDTTYLPDNRSKYTIEFGRDGRVRVRVDCNRGSSTWRSPKAGELAFGSWSRTTAKCGPRSLHDKIVTEGANVRTYVLKDGHLFLSGMAGGGFYELEPLRKLKNVV